MNQLRLESIVALNDKQGGAARMTIFLALWSLALVVLHDVHVDAATIQERPTPSSNWLAAPIQPPKIESTEFWNSLAERSDVMSGRWTRQVKSTAHRKATQAAHVALQTPVRAPMTPTTIAAAPAGNVKSSSTFAETERRVAGEIAEREFDEAAASIAAVRSLDGNDSRLRLLDARVSMARGDFERACTELLENLPDVRVATEQHDLLAAAMLRTGRYAESTAVYRALLGVDPRNARWWAGYAVTQNELGHRAESVSAYRALASLAPRGSPLSAWAIQQLERMT